MFFQEIKQEIKSGNSLNIFFLLFLISVPFHHTINNFFGAIFLLTFLFFYKRKLNLDSSIILPFLLYLSMCVSFFFTVDERETVKALIKELPLLFVPLVFLFSKQKDSIKKQITLKYYSYSIVFLTLFFFLKAIVSYIIAKDLNVFFYHNLVSKELNAIHVSVFVSMALFYFLTKESKKSLDFILTCYLFLFLILLSSKIIIFTTILLIAIFFFFYSKSANKMRLRNLIIVGSIISTIFYFGTIKEKLQFEFNIKSDSNIGHTVISKKEVGSNIISMKEAWFNEKFNQTDYFSGSSFRVYQTRLFFEFLKEENIFWTGFGLNASYDKLEEKGIHYNVFQGNDEVEGYQKKNFHNQYLQTFAELGVVGFILLLLILGVNLKNAFKSKDFIHIAFAILMISLFLTESFLWRQRGVVFFILFYCLFNTINSPQIKNKIK